MTAKTVRDQQRHIRALAALAEQFPHLPADSFLIDHIDTPHGYTAGIVIKLHTTFADFEAWRAALGIDPATTKYQLLSSCQTLRGWTVFEGIDVELIVYAPLPDPVPLKAA